MYDKRRGHWRKKIIHGTVFQTREKADAFLGAAWGLITFPKRPGKFSSATIEPLKHVTQGKIRHWIPKEQRHG
jgi:hypothetical protein